LSQSTNERYYLSLYLQNPEPAKAKKKVEIKPTATTAIEEEFEF
jgi:hypothetical protein